MAKKVLIPVYYWPPAGGAGVQRWVKFVKYLREFGWEPVVYTVENGDYPILDDSFEKDIPEGVEVIHRPIVEPFELYRAFSGKKKGEKIDNTLMTNLKQKNWKERFAAWIRGNFFIPDARVWWIRPSISFLEKWLQENKVEVIVSSGPPHSVHLIAKGIKAKTGLPWLADFRDPWTGIDYFADLNLTDWARKKHFRLEKEVLTSADAVTVVGSKMKMDFEALGGKNISVLTNGFDAADYEALPPRVENEKFVLAHIGSLYRTRNPKVLWEALQSLCQKHPELKQDLEIRLIGKTDDAVLESLKSHDLFSYSVVKSYIPHSEVAQNQIQADVLLLLIDVFDGGKWVLTGKFFEYLAANRPILCVGPQDGQVAEIIRETGAGTVVDFDNPAAAETAVWDMYQKWKNKSLSIQSSGTNKYSRRSLTEQLSVILQKIAR